MKKIVLLLVGLVLHFIGLSQITFDDVSYRTAVVTENNVVTSSNFGKIKRGLVIWSSDFTSSSDWVITNNASTGSLNWVITSTMPTSANLKTWLTSASNVFNSASKGNFAFVDGSTKGAGIRTAIITTKNPVSTLGKTNVMVKFNQLYARWQDVASVEVSTDNSTWTPFTYNNKYKENQTTQNPENVSIDISSIAANKSTVWVRFKYVGTPNDYDYGWFLDDVSIEEIPQNDLIVFSGYIKGQTQAVQSCLGSEEIGFFVINKGLTSVPTGTPIGYKINSNPVVTENANWLNYNTLKPKTTLVYGDTALCVFTTKADLSAELAYAIKAFVTLPSDQSVSNDTVTLGISNLVSKTVDNVTSYTENFEAGKMNGFTNEDIDKRGYKFGLASTGNTAVTTTTVSTAAACIRISEPKGASEDWAYSPCLNLKPGYLYTLSYYTRLSANVAATSTAAAVNFAGNIESKLGKSAVSSAMTQLLSASKTLTPDGKYQQVTTTFSVTEPAVYYLGFHVANTDTSKSSAVRIDDISLTAKSTQSELTSYNFTSPLVSGVISGTDIALTVPAGTDVSKLIANFVVSKGATVVVVNTPQVSGTTVNNFTTPLTYVVTAEDGVSKSTYKVTVTITQSSNSSAKDLLSFSFSSPAVTGVISGSDVAVTVPSGTDVTKLIAAFTSSPLSNVKIGQVLQISGQTSNDFTSLVTYVVTAEDGSTKLYFVKVTVTPAAKSTACDLLSFGILSPLKSGIVNGTDVLITLPSGTNLSTLAATFTVSTGASVTVNSVPQVSGTTVNNFTTSVDYIVTAEDAKTTKTYKVLITTLPTTNLVLWSSDFSKQSDWTITNNSATGSLNWVITSTMPTSANLKNWLASANNSFNSTSKGNFALVDGSTAGAGERTAIMTMTTPVSTSGKSNVMVKFSQLYARWQDVASVEVSTDNSTWTPFTYNNKYKSSQSSANPEKVSIDISSAAGNKSSVWVRFKFVGTANDFDYAWFVDDFSVEEIPQNDLSVISGYINGQTQAVQSCLGATDIGIYVVNKGLKTITSGTPVSYKVNSNSIVTESASWLDYKTKQAKATLAYGDTALCVFTTKADLSAELAYSIKAFVTLPSDQSVSNDTVTLGISNLVSKTVDNVTSYTENFEAGKMNGFTNEDIDKRGYKFGLASTGNTAVTTTTVSTAAACIRISEPKGASEDWAYSPCLNLKPGYLYTLSYYTRLSASVAATSTAAAVNFAGNIESKLGKSAVSSAMTQLLSASKTLTPDGKYQQLTTTFSVTEPAVYYLGFHVTNTDTSKSSAVRIDDISLTAKSTQSELTSYNFTSPLVSGVISGTDIALTVPAGTDVSKLIANFVVSKGATVVVVNTPQVSGTTVNNFTTPLTYVVTAEDGVSKSTYKVTVTITQSSNSSAKDLLSFSFSSPAVTGVISGSDVAVTVPSGTDVTKLIAAFTSSPLSKVKIGQVLQTSGQTSNDFTSLVTYVVTAEDGSTKLYFVKVTVTPAAKSTACDLLSFGILSPLKSGIVNGTDVLITLPSGTNLSTLAATFTVSTGASVTVNSVPQVSGTTVNNFTTSVDYIVTAEDAKTTKTYKVLISTLPTTNLVLWSSDFSKSTDWTITNNSATGSLNWVITSTMPTSANLKNWLASANNSFNSTSKGNFALLDGSTAGAGERTAIMTMTTPVSTSGKSNVMVKFNQLYARWQDVASVEVSTDNSTWTPFTYNNKYKSSQSSANPEKVSIDISSAAGNKSSVWVRFKFVGTANDFDYAWFVDDFSVEEIPQNDLSVISGYINGQTQAVQSCLGATDIGIYVVNKGLKTITSGTPVSYKVNSNSIVTESASWLDYKTKQAKATLAYGDTALCVFTTKADLSAELAYSIKAFVTLPSDQSVSNDTVTLGISNLVSKTVDNVTSYTENFEAGKMNGFTNEDIDKRGYKFGLASTGNTAVTTTTVSTAAACIRISEPKGASEDWAYSPCLNLKPGYLYTLSYYTRLSASVAATATAAAVNFAGNIESKLGKSAVSSAMTLLLSASKTLTPDGKYLQVTTTFSVTEPAVYYLGFHVTNTDTSKSSAVRIDDISLTAKSTQSEITAFDIKTPAASATISGTDISVTLPLGTDVKSLISNFVVSNGASVKVGGVTQVSGTTANDFTSIVNYEVTAEDGVTKKIYKVTINISTGNSSAKDLLTFGFANPSVSGVISGLNVSITVPAGTNVSALIATFTSSNLSKVKIGSTLQVSGQTTNDFTKPVTYVITAEDGSTKTYTVTVTVGSTNTTSGADIVSFGFTNPNVTGVITGTSIAVSVPYGTNVTSLVSTFTTSTGATVKVSNIVQNSGGSVINYSTPITFTVTSQDGKTIKTYTVSVTITPLLSSAKEMMTFGFASPNANGTITGNTIGLTVPFGTNLSALVANFTSSPNSIVRVGSTVQVSGTTPNSFVSSLMYTVVAQDGSAKDYTVVVTVSSQSGGSGSSAKDILSFGLLNPYISGTITGNTITISGQAGSDITKQQISFSISPGATLTLNGVVQTTNISIVNFSNPVTLKVTATDGSTKEYVVTVTIPKKSEKAFTFFRFIESPSAIGVIDEAKKTITVHVPQSFANNLNFTAVFGVSTGAIVRIGNIQQSSGASQLPYKTTVVFTVVAEDGKTAMYTIIIIVDPQAAGIEEEQEDNSLVRIFPNPSSGVFTCESSIESYDFTVTDILGHTVYSTRVEPNGTSLHTFDLDSFGSGVYFATLQFGTSSKLIKLEVIK